MEERKRVLLSSVFEKDVQTIFEYGVSTFGFQTAESYRRHLLSLSYKLDDFYLMYPTCRHIPTKGNIYRNIILESHLIIYRVKVEHIEVLRILHSKSSINRIRSVRSIEI